VKKYFLLIPLIFIGCNSIQSNVEKIKNFSKCYVHHLPAPFWVCYQSTFLAVGKVYTDKISRLKQEEAFSKALNELIEKISLKIKKLQKYNPSIKLEEVKNFVLINAIEKDTWYEKKNHIIYVEAALDEDDFKEFLASKFKDKKEFEKIYNEIF